LGQKKKKKKKKKKNFKLLPRTSFKMTLESQLKETLNNRRQISKLRRLVVNPPNAIDFSSNDFLGLSHNNAFKSNYLQELETLPTILGSTGSRLLDGNSAYCEAIEKRIADFHNSQTALIFNSGFDANAGLFSTVPQRGDIILYDELIHASVHEGMRMSRAAKRIAFLHSDVLDFERLLKQVIVAHPGKNIFVAVETVYSMDGDIAPLREFVDVVRKYWPNKENGYIIVDEVSRKQVPSKRYIKFIYIYINKGSQYGCIWPQRTRYSISIGLGK
jgi:8-amino-7-oxononanoate synthase